MNDIVREAEFKLVVNGQNQLRDDIRSMASEHRESMNAISQSQADLNNKFTQFLEITKSHADDIGEIKTSIHCPEEGLMTRMRRVELKQTAAQEGNATRWKMLGAFITSTLALGTGFATFIYWLVRTIPIK